MRLLMMMMGWSAMMGSTHPKTINEAIQDIVTSAPANCLADIYADKEDELDDSDAEDRGAGINLDPVRNIIKIPFLFSQFLLSYTALTISLLTFSFP